eukprot:Unigene12367_Nuclearia_a/m.37585 Unigene12367_Nuclearia_a/g.37585  ORF Unigene12367_Nuclearia_a/g.37585 Unigene12367_Nuclearia_a/m.37585 type:complete len:154 (+) Unigene12367_Nuclearia_a:85-546(+)
MGRSVQAPRDGDATQSKTQKKKAAKAAKKAAAKKAAKKSTADAADAADAAVDAGEAAAAGQTQLAYLRTWKTARDTWKFNKKDQTWLLKHALDQSKVPDDDFDTLLEYVDSLRGSSRNITLDQARMALNAEDDDNDAATTRRARAAQLVKVLE